MGPTSVRPGSPPDRRRWGAGSTRWIGQRPRVTAYGPGRVCLAAPLLGGYSDSSVAAAARRPGVSTLPGSTATTHAPGDPCRRSSRTAAPIARFPPSPPHSWLGSQAGCSRLWTKPSRDQRRGVRDTRQETLHRPPVEQPHLSGRAHRAHQDRCGQRNRFLVSVLRRCGRIWRRSAEGIELSRQMFAEPSPAERTAEVGHKVFDIRVGRSGHADHAAGFIRHRLHKCLAETRRASGDPNDRVGRDEAKVPSDTS